MSKGSGSQGEEVMFNHTLERALLLISLNLQEQDVLSFAFPRTFSLSTVKDFQIVLDVRGSTS